MTHGIRAKALRSRSRVARQPSTVRGSIYGLVVVVGVSFWEIAAAAPGIGNAKGGRMPTKPAILATASPAPTPPSQATPTPVPAQGTTQPPKHKTMSPAPEREAERVPAPSAHAPHVSDASRGPWEEVYARNVTGIVYILSDGLCSGAFIAEDLVLTAAHCVSGSRTIRVGWEKGARKEGRYEYEGGVVVAALSVREDLAILRLPRKHGATILPLAPAGTTFRSGEPVATIGHPSALSPLSSTGLYEPQLFLLTQGPVAKPNDALVVADMLVLPGNSGGPVFDTQGQIVGVVSARHRDGDLGYFVPVARILPLLERARGSNVDERQRPFLGSGALALHAGIESDRYLKSLYGGKQNVFTIAPSVTFYRLLRLTYTTRVGPQDARKRQWDARAVGRLEVTRLADAEFGLGVGQVFYDDEERRGAAKESPVVVADAGMGGFRFGLAFPWRAFGKPTFSIGLDLMGVL